MRKFLVLTITLCSSSFGLFAQNKADERLQDSSRVLHEIMDTPDKGIPQDLLNKAYCVVVIPGAKKAAFIVGGEYGKGFAVCRRHHAGWGAPAAVIMEGGSFGFQIGGADTDVVMLVMNEHGMKELDKSKVTLGADASVAAGPVGRTAAADTDAFMTAEILSWSRSKGVFAGIALKGASLRSDEKDNAEIYGQPMPNHDILMTATPVPAAARPLITELDRYSMHKDNADRTQ